eukprot:NP_497184.3 Uncharacterized protein CELE_Y50D7A.1 [Caenorhabditis elegans]
MEPSPDGQLEIIANSGAKSVIWEDRIAEFGYEKYFLRLPEPALNKVLRYLRYPDLQTLKSICPELTDLCDLHVKLMDHSEFYTHPKFQFERCSPDDEEEEVVAGRIRSPRTSSSSGQLDKVADEFVVKDVEIMSERQNACATYFEPTRSLYLFGGEAIDGDEHTPGAVFNDLWRLDTATLKWSRVIISSAPYPSAMCYASLVTWGTQLILFGGNDNRRRCPFANVPPELHYFDTSTSTWRYVPATGNSPSSIGHSAVVSGDYMFVYGGWPFIHNELHLETPLRVERLQILDIRHETWKTVQLEKWNPADPAPFPRFHTRKTKLILIRDGLLLITGELIPQDYGSSVLLQYDVTNPLNDTWRWKSIPTIGRWWGRKFLQMEVRGEAVFRLNPECSMPNIEFHQIADVRNEKMIRLVSLGRLRSECAPLVRATFAEEYDAVQSGYRDFARQLKCHLEMEYKRRIDTSSNDTCAIFKYLNLVCKIGGCFVRGKTPSTPTTSSHANSQRFHIHVRSIPRRGQNDEPKMPRFDDVDLWELRCTIRATQNTTTQAVWTIWLREFRCVIVH